MWIDEERERESGVMGRWRKAWRDNDDYYDFSFMIIALGVLRLQLYYVYGGPVVVCTQNKIHLSTHSSEGSAVHKDRSHTERRKNIRKRKIFGMEYFGVLDSWNWIIFSEGRGKRFRTVKSAFAFMWGGGGFVYGVIYILSFSLSSIAELLL